MRRFHGIILSLVLLGFFFVPVYAVNVVNAQGGDTDAVTITAAGNQSYLLGQEIQLSGINLESDTVYLFITGPGLAPEGAPLHNPHVSVYGGGWTTIGVLPDNTWAYTWQTKGLDIDAGTYVIYAVPNPRAKTNLGESSYGTLSVTLNIPSVTASVSHPIIIAGQPISVSGVVEGNPSPGVAVWIMGENFTSVSAERVNENGTYQYEITEAITSEMTSGQYFVVVQHPMQNNIFDVIRQGDFVVGAYPVRWTTLFRIRGEGSLQGSEAADALAVALDNPAIDDTYSRVQFQVSPNPPQLPHAFYGTITIEGKPAPVNTNVSTTVAGGKDEINYLLTTQEGKYGGTDDNSPELMVQGSIEKGAPIVFFVDGKQAEVYDVAAGGQWQATYPFKPGRVTNLNLRVNTALSDLYYISASSAEGGAIEPGGVVEVMPGSAVTFTITASPGYKIENVLVDGATVGVLGTYTFTNVTGNHTISASFTSSGGDGSGFYHITTTSYEGGVIEPDGVVEVVPGSAVTFTITANPGYKIQNVLVDGATVGVLGTYTFTNVTGNHTISASFTSAGSDGSGFYYISASSAEGGTIEPGGVVKVVPGSAVTFTITANPGYKIQNVLVDGESKGVLGTYTFTNVTGNHTLSASFTLSGSDGGGSVGTGTLFVTSSPRGAEIYIDGIASGQTNAYVRNIAAGTRNVTVTKPGYQTETKLVSVQTGGRYSVSFTLQPGEGAGTGTGTLLVTSIPQGAVIYIDGIASGQTNTSVPNIAAGTRNVTVTKPGYQTATELVSVQAGESKSVSFTLQPGEGEGTGTGTLLVTSSPRGAVIYIDGIASGQTNAYVRNVAAGTRNVTLVKPGYQTATELVSVQEGERTTVSLTLQPEEGAGTGTDTFFTPIRRGASRFIDTLKRR